MGFEEATPIQSQAITSILSGRDIIGQAQTGTGKTAAFGIPAIQNIDVSLKAVQAIVLCPTRELAVQVSDELHKLCKYMHGLKTIPIYGGQDIVRQIKALKSGAQIIVGTPGRTLDHIRRKTVPFNNVKMLILDEADEMLNMGFKEDIELILSAVPEDRQTVMFSATMPPAIVDIAKNYQKDADHIKVVKKELTVSNIEQCYFEVRHQDKFEVLTRLLDVYNPTLSIVFSNTKLKVDELVADLQGRGYFAEGLHGDMNQQARLRVLTNCRQGKTDILVATDVAARGIDIENVDFVFNYDIPQDEEYYVHRIGRTGRAGRKGMSFSFVTGREIYKLREIERYCKTKIELRPIPTLREITDCRLTSAFGEIRELIANKNLATVKATIEELINTSDLTAMDVAAALLYKTANLDIEEIKPGAKTDRGGKTDRNGKSKSKKTRVESGMTRLFINVGKRDKIKPSNILGAVAGEAKIDGDSIGSIDMYDNYSFVDVPETSAYKVIKAMNGIKIKGRAVNMEISGAGRGDRKKDKNHDKGHDKHKDSHGEKKKRY
ncbi:MAG: DEAD/DEAH box helicase [Lachnospiraceae bacterium]